MMKKQNKIISRIVLILLVIAGCLSNRSIFAENSSVTISTGVDDVIEDKLQFDFYEIADIVWDGKANEDGTPKQTTFRLKVNEDLSASLVGSSFDDLDVGVDKETGNLWSGQTYLELAALGHEAAGIVFGDDYNGTATTTDAGTACSLVSGKLYLAIARSDKTPIDSTDDYLIVEGDEYHSFAYSYDHKYIFEPYLVFVYDSEMSVEFEDTKEMLNGDVVVKYTEEPRYGRAEIIKFVKVYGGEKTDTDILFSVKGYSDESCDDEYLVYDKLIPLHINKAGTYDPIVLEDIPVGTYVIVTEIYSGASYKLITPNDDGETQVITPYVPDEEDYEPNGPQVWHFTNTYNDKSKQGYGVVNTFTYNDGEWDYHNDLPED